MNAILAIDGGGTRTRAGLYDESGNLLAEAEGDATNLTTTSPGSAVQIIRGLAQDLINRTGHGISSVAAGISGAGRTGQAKLIATALARDLGTDAVRVCSDAHMLAWANLDEKYPVLVIAGTGSCVITRKPDGSRIVTGGWGPIIGDEGGGFRLALEAVKWADEDKELRQSLLSAAGVESLPELHKWASFGRANEVAALATLVLQLAQSENAGALAAVRDQVGRLAALTRHGLARAGTSIDEIRNLPIVVSGGLMQSQFYAEQYSSVMLDHLNSVSLEQPRFVGHRAALELQGISDTEKILGRPHAKESSQSHDDVPDRSTESNHDWGVNLDDESPGQISRLMSTIEVGSLSSLMYFKRAVGDTIAAAAACLRAGGRIIYAGAGTSGRLGVLDASECPPTFGVDQGRVIGLIAGGDEALRHSIEGAEDDTGLARKDIDAISPPVGANDIVIGITASGTTPYALAAIDRATELGAKTGLVACNPVPLDRADHVIALDTGPEVLPGSTRLKAGTATKIVLNQISTGAMAKSGYVFEGRMVGVQPSNNKLRRRCIRIIAELTKEDEAAAEKRLDETGGSIRLAVLMARKGLNLDEARRRLEAAHGILRDALETK